MLSSDLRERIIARGGSHRLENVHAS